jgi:hypothetical protein
MTGPKHYKTGDAIFAALAKDLEAGERDTRQIEAAAALAQAHYTAALVAATILAADPDENSVWWEAIT